MGSMKKKMSRKQKLALGLKVSKRVSQSNGEFPDDDDDSSSAGSGTDSSKVRCHRRKTIKSGSKVRIRPVKKTELWPHTIANESNDEDITHETIS